MNTSIPTDSVQFLDALPSHSTLHTFCSTGDLDSTRAFFEIALPNLRPKQLISYCSHAGPKCDHIPCLSFVAALCETAARSNQVDVFTYLCDAFLSSNEDGTIIVRIPWQCLRSAAILGSLSLAEAFFNRDPDCFKSVAPAAPHGTSGGTSQISIAIRHDHLDYIDYMLVHGADINMPIHTHNVLIGVVTSAIDNATCLRRLRSLIERGATVAGSGVIEAAISEGRVSVVQYLLSNSDTYAAHHADALPNTISSATDVKDVSESKSQSV
ncbi:hypothetical protein BDR22DRAFT_962894 [Usnea florida]